MPSEPATPVVPTTHPPAGVPPPLLAASTRRPSSGRRFLIFLLSVYLGLFLADAAFSLADDTLTAFFGLHFLSVLRLLVGVFAVLMAVLIYGLMALTPMVPKRFFLPLTLSNLAAMLVSVPLLIYFYSRIQLIGWSISLCQVILGLGILYCSQGGFKFRWPLVGMSQLNPRRFSWLNLSGFVLVNIFVLVPVVIVYLFLSIALAVDHFSEGFVALRPSGITVQVRKYVRDDGKVIELFPMAHVADADFYQKVSETFPTNSIILMEGVTDDQNLLTNKISYKRMARSLGLAEQHEQFKPGLGKIVPADVDIGIFSKETIGLLNLVMLIHANGINPEILRQLTLYTPPPNFEEQLFADLLGKRNEHLLGEIQSHLAQSDNLMIPWGAAHMPGIAHGILKSGFHLDETREYMVIRFRGFGSSGKAAGPVSGNAKAD
jgi:hypothetical protein